MIDGVLPLALGAAISPTVLTAGILVLSGKAHPLARFVFYTLGTATMVAAIGIVGLLTLDATVSSAQHGPSRASAIIDLSIGALLLALAVRILVRGPIGKRSRKPDDSEHGAGQAPHPGRYYVLGLVMMATNFTTLALYLPLLKQIVRSGASTFSQISTLVISDAIILAPVLLPLAAYLLAPKRAAAMLASLNGFVQRNGKYVSATLAAGFGIYLAAKGIDRLS